MSLLSEYAFLTERATDFAKQLKYKNDTLRSHLQSAVSLAEKSIDRAELLLLYRRISHLYINGTISKKQFKIMIKELDEKCDKSVYT